MDDKDGPRASSSIITASSYCTTISQSRYSSTPILFFPLSRCVLGMLLPLFYLTLLVSLPWSLASPLSLPTAIRRAPGFHLPLSRREIYTSTPRRPKQSAIGLGDYFDVCVFKRTTAVSSSWNQYIQCASSNRRDACTTRPR
jgi:hypothetical protein